jgi:hypothetical protein
MTQTKKKPADDPWRTPWRHSYVTRPVAWCVTVWLALVVIRELAVPLPCVVAAAAVIAAAAPVIAAGFRLDLAWRWFAGILFAAIGAYSTWVLGTRQFLPGVLDWLPTRDAFLVWPVAAGAFGSWWWWLRAVEFHTDRLEKAEARQAEVDAERGRYLPIIKRVLKKKPEWQGITEKGRIPFEAGFTLVLRLPADGSITFADLDRLTGTAAAPGPLEIAADVRPGSLVFEQPLDGTAAEVHMHVFERDVLSETIPLPFDRGPKSIHQPMNLGLYATGEVCVVTFREVAGLMVGLRGSGKSSLLNTHLAHLTGCVDALVWMIDLKGGETLQPWVRPFLEATTDRAAIDWAATTPEEADAMLIALNAAIQARTKANKGRKWKPTAERPAIILIVEEASLVTGVGKYGNIDRAGKLQDAVSTGRSAAVDAMVMSQRATVDMIGTGSMKSNLNLRYGLQMVSLEEARMVFPDGNAARALARLPKGDRYRGAFLVQSPNDGARIMHAKGYRVEEDWIGGIAMTNAPFQPDLDEFTVSAVEDALTKAGVSGGYAGRWDRLRDVLGYDVPETDEASQGASPEASPNPSQAPSQTASPAPSQATPQERGRAVIADAVRRHRETARETETARERETFERLMREAFPTGELAGETGPGTSHDPGQATPYTVSHDVAEAVADAIGPASPEVPPFLRLMAAVFAVRTEDALPTQLLLDHMPGDLTPHKLGRLAATCGFGSVENVTDPATGQRVRGYRREDVARVAVEIGEGRFTAPPSAFDWRP